MAKNDGKALSVFVFVFLFTFMGWVLKAQAAEHIVWKMQTAWQQAADVISYFQQPFADLVKERSKGRLEIKWMVQGAILAPDEVFTGISKGVVQGGCSCGANHFRIVPEAYIEFGIPYNFETYDQFYNFFYDYKDRAFLKLLEDAYRPKGVRLLALVAANEVFHTKFPINKIEDIKGKKIRAVGGAAKLVKSLGGTAINLPMPELYTALQRGTVDGTVAPVMSARTAKIAEVIQYTTLPALFMVSIGIYCNLDAYNKLSPDLKKIVDEAAVDAARSYAKSNNEREISTIEEARRLGVKIESFPKKEVLRMVELGKPIWDEAATMCPRCAEQLDILRAYKKEKSIFQ